MEKIVQRGMKIDLHIHSCFSAGKDDALVKDGSVENLAVLYDGLNRENVNVFAITDHDCFSYDMYNAAKNYQPKGSVQKNLPGIEFSVNMDGDNEPKLVHVIAIFDDGNQEALQRLSSLLPPNNVPYDLKDQMRFSEAGFFHELQTIGLNAVLIAHQKNSETSRHPQNQDVNSLGVDRFNEIINIEYFDAFEYRTENQSIYHTLFQKTINHEEYERIRYLTGSDCHQWKAYPNETQDSNTGTMEYTFLKCLPTFKGLVMSVTDASRMGKSADFFYSVKKSINEIRLKIDGQETTIPVSKGVNVIIGDNSVGKSLLLHELTSFSNLDGSHNIPDTRRQDYQRFLADNRLEINTIIPSGDFLFNSQGDIRFHFEKKNIASTFLSSLYPSDLSKEPFVQFINDALVPFYSCLEAKFKFDSDKKALPTLSLCAKPGKFKILSAAKIQKTFTDALQTKGLKN